MASVDLHGMPLDTNDEMGLSEIVNDLNLIHTYTYYKSKKFFTLWLNQRMSEKYWGNTRKSHGLAQFH